MFFTRNDGSTISRAKRRVKSTRASAFLEFALIGAILMMVVSALVEFVELWDAKVMANHSAWVCSRIASVESGLYKKDTEKVSVTKGMKTATTILMATCSMGMFGGKDGTYERGWLEDLIKPLQEALKEKITQSFKDVVDKIISKIGGGEGNPLSKILTEISKALLTNLIEPLVDKLAEVAIDILHWGIIDKIYELVSDQRQLRQLAHAARRIAQDNVIVVKERDEWYYQFKKTNTNPKSGELHFPRVLEKDVKTDDSFVTEDRNWPAYNGIMRLITVDVNWPFSRGWVFPIFSSNSLKGDLAGKGVAAVGHAIAFPQPRIHDEHLKSYGGEPFDPGSGVVITNNFDDLRAEFLNFLKVACFAMTYRLGREHFGPHDADNKTSYSWKGLGLEGDCDPPWGKKTGRDHRKDAYFAKDGLCYWMGRADPNDSSTWGQDKWKNASKDYKKCWEEVADAGETVKFWNGVPFGWGPFDTIPTAAYKRVKDIGANRGKMWFHWGSENGQVFRHRRHRKSWDSRTYEENYLANLINKNENNYQSFLGVDAEVEATAWWPNENDYNARTASLEGGAIGYSELVTWAQENKAYRPNLYNWRKCIADESRRNDFYEREKKVVSRVMKDFTWWRNRILQLVTDEELELERMVFKDDREPGDTPDGVYDFGVSDEEIMKDPEKAKEKMQEKLNQIKAETMPILYQITKKIQELESAHGPLKSTFDTVVSTRREDLSNWLAAVGNCIVRGGKVSASDDKTVFSRLVQYHACGKDPRTDTAQLEAAVDKYAKLLEDLHELEIQYGEKLNLKAAKEERKKKDEGEVDPGVDPAYIDPIPKPSMDGGSDDDAMTNSWNLTDEGWVPTDEGDDL